MYNDPKGQACTLCGDGISSEPRDLDENPKAANGTLVRATSASCCECCCATAKGRPLQDAVPFTATCVWLQWLISLQLW